MNFNKKAVNIETVSSEMNNFGLNIIDKENYMTGETKLKMIDNFGYMYLISPYSVRGAIKRNNFIRKFSKANPFTIYNIKNFLKLLNSDTLLLSEEYITIKDCYKFKCGKCGKIFRCKLDYLVNSERRNEHFVCRKCSREELACNQRENYEDILKVFSENDIVPLFDKEDYKNSQSKLKYKTTEGYLGEIGYGHLKKRGMDDVSMFQQDSKYFEYNINLLCEKLGVNFDGIFEYKENINRTLLSISCPECGNIFHTTKVNLIKGKTRCNSCTKKKSKIEKKTEEWLNNNKIRFTEQKKFENLKYKKYLFFDFYLEDLNLVIECDGEFHYSVNSLTTKKEFDLQKIRDGIKNEYCKENNIKLLRIPYWDFKNKKYEQILENNILNQK